MHANREGTNKLPIKLNAMENKLNTMICYQIGKTSRKAKTPPDDFKVITPKNLLINNQVVTNIRNPTNYPSLFRNSNLQLNFRSNIQLDLIL